MLADTDIFYDIGGEEQFIAREQFFLDSNAEGLAWSGSLLLRVVGIKFPIRRVCFRPILHNGGFVHEGV